MTYSIDGEAWGADETSSRGGSRDDNRTLGCLKVAARTRAEMCSTTLEQIRLAATESVVANGFDGLSMEDVALRAGCSRATVYRRVGDKEAILDLVLNQAIARVTSSVAQTVDPLDGGERLIAAMTASLDILRTDPVASALLAGPAAARSVDSALISSFTDRVAKLSGIDPDDAAACEIVSRVTLALLCWPVADRRTETDIIRRLASPGGLFSRRSSTE
jgi:AcrR family transcriptional regulator